MSQLSGILYYSFARDGISDEALQNIVTRARARNSALSVTGQLHFENRLFLQWLEGEKAELNKIWDIVSADPQHSSLSLVFQGEIPKRYFPKWKMAHTNRKDALLLHYLQKRGLSVVRVFRRAEAVW
ncbi:MAG: BLUF domain-containing protein [Pseudomonadota bacterium]